MARKERQAVYPWVSLGGSSRRYFNTVTGDTISRERYERYYGSLFKRGAKSFKQATKATPEEVRQSRPARGRGAATKRFGAQNITGLRPLIGRLSRNVVLPFDVYYDGDADELFEQAEDYREDYDDARLRVINNKAVTDVSLIVAYSNGDRSGFYTIRRIEDKRTLATYDEFLEDLARKAYPGDTFSDLTFHMRFAEWALRKKREPAKGLKFPPGYRPVRRL